MTGQILTFTNLFPSAARPQHGCFVKDRMQRVAAHSGLEWQVVGPVPRGPRLLRRPLDRESVFSTMMSPPTMDPPRRVMSPR